MLKPVVHQDDVGATADGGAGAGDAVRILRAERAGNVLRVWNGAPPDAEAFAREGGFRPMIRTRTLLTPLIALALAACATVPAESGFGDVQHNGSLNTLFGTLGFYQGQKRIQT